MDDDQTKAAVDLMKFLKDDDTSSAEMKTKTEYKDSMV